MNIIELDNITYIYHSKTEEDASSSMVSAISGITFSCLKNSITVILGPSGAGKTTLLNVVSTKSRPTAGDFLLFQKKPFALDTKDLQTLRKEKIGYFSQELYLNFIGFLSLRQNIDLLEYNIPKEELIYWLEKLNLSERYLDVPIDFFSRGEQQRIGIIVLLCQDPDIFIFDEPTSFLDLDNVRRVLELIILLKEKGKTIIIATHDESFIPLADKILILNRGKILDSKRTENIAETVKEFPMIPGIPATKEFQLTIPDIIFQQIDEDSIFIMEEIDDYSISFRKLSKHDFDRFDKENWIFINEYTFQIPEEFLAFPWREEPFDWQITDNGLIIRFKEDFDDN